jgi:tetratricopeptide (TPR) repeat protein
MFYGNPLRLILEWKIPNGTDFDNFILLITAKYERLVGHATELFGPNGGLIMVLFFSLIGLIIVIYALSLFNELHASKSDDYENYYDDEQEFADEQWAAETETFTDIPEETVAQFQAQLEEEKEISRNIIAASETSDDFLHISEDYSRLKDIMQRHANNQKGGMSVWHSDANTLVLNEKERAVHLYISPIIQLLGRQVSEPKTAQAVFCRANPPKSEEDVLQTVRSIRDFIGLARYNTFANLPDSRKLPNPAAALAALADKGDNSLCLELLKHLTTQYIDDADAATGIQQKFLFAQAANYACLAGNFAALDDTELALLSYNFASEIAPENVNAWSRIGDVYLNQGNLPKAMFAYQSVLELADTPMYSQQIANAKAHLAQYYEQQGLTVQAENYREASEKYYEEYGLRTPLSEAEDAAFDVILSRQDINTSLTALLQPDVAGD